MSEVIDELIKAIEKNVKPATFPVSKFESLTQGLAVMRKKGMYRYPVPNMNLMNKPDMPEKYSVL